MTGDLTHKGNSEPERWWRSRAEREALRKAKLKAELEEIKTASEMEAARIRAAGRARVHRDRLRYTAALTTAAAEHYEDTTEDIQQQMRRNPADELLNIGLATILGTGLQAFSDELEQHRRDGREQDL